MQVRLTLLDGEELILTESTLIKAWKSAPNDELFYLEQIYENSYDGVLSAPSKVATKYPEVGFASLFSEADWFTIAENFDTRLIKTSSIKSIDCLNNY